jgi:Leucine-rich repeat (LRR) protein
MTLNNPQLTPISQSQVVAVEVADSQLTRLGSWVSGTFGGGSNIYGEYSDDESVDTDDDLDVEGGPSEVDATRARRRRAKARSLDTHLHHITVNRSPLLRSVDNSLNRFTHLTSLNLSGNNIYSIEGPLDLPMLKSLDLSYNKLKTLDYLQLLTRYAVLVELFFVEVYSSRISHVPL